MSVIRKEGEPVDTLRPEDLAIFENKASGEILKLERGMNETLSVAILIDTSASQQGSLGGTKLAAQKFAGSILQNGKNHVALISFSGAATVEQELTNDLAKLRAAIDRIKFIAPTGYVGAAVVIGGLPPIPVRMPAGGATAIWDTIKFTTDGILQSLDGSRGVILLLSDGEDTNSKTKMRDVIVHAAAQDIAIFSVGIGDDNNYGLNREKLNKVSEETGGRAFFPKKVKELDVTLREIEQQLRSPYFLTYCTLDQRTIGSLLKIKIGIRNPQLRHSKLRLLYPHFGL